MALLVHEHVIVYEVVNVWCHEILEVTDITRPSKQSLIWCIWGRWILTVQTVLKTVTSYLFEMCVYGCSIQIYEISPCRYIIALFVTLNKSNMRAYLFIFFANLILLDIPFNIIFTLKLHCILNKFKPLMFPVLYWNF